MSLINDQFQKAAKVLLEAEDEVLQTAGMVALMRLETLNRRLKGLSTEGAPLTPLPPKTNDNPFSQTKSSSFGGTFKGSGTSQPYNFSSKFSFGTNKQTSTNLFGTGTTTSISTPISSSMQGTSTLPPSFGTTPSWLSTTTRAISTTKTNVSENLNLFGSSSKSQSNNSNLQPVPKISARLPAVTSTETKPASALIGTGNDSVDKITENIFTKSSKFLTHYSFSKRDSPVPVVPKERVKSSCESSSESEEEVKIVTVQIPEAASNVKRSTTSKVGTSNLTRLTSNEFLQASTATPNPNLNLPLVKKEERKNLVAYQLDSEKKYQNPPQINFYQKFDTFQNHFYEYKKPEPVINNLFLNLAPSYERSEPRITSGYGGSSRSSGGGGCRCQKIHCGDRRCGCRKAGISCGSNCLCGGRPGMCLN